MKNMIFGIKYKVSFHCLVHGQVVEDFYQIKDFEGMEIDIQFIHNLSYIREGNYAKRKVIDLSSSLQQLTIIKKGKGLNFTSFSEQLPLGKIMASLISSMLNLADLLTSTPKDPINMMNSVWYCEASNPKEIEWLICF